MRRLTRAVGFTAEQAGFEDFVEKIFNTSVSLLKNLEKTSVSILFTVCRMKATICVSGSFVCNVAACASACAIEISMCNQMVYS